MKTTKTGSTDIKTKVAQIEASLQATILAETGVLVDVAAMPADGRLALFCKTAEDRNVAVKHVDGLHNGLRALPSLDYPFDAEDPDFARFLAYFEM